MRIFTNYGCQGLWGYTDYKLAAPTNLTATLLSGPMRIRLTWRDNANNETGFVIERSVNGGPFTQNATLGRSNRTGLVSFTTSTIVPGNTYAYRVRAVIGTAPSAYSNTVSVIVPTLPVAPSNLTGTGSGFQVTIA